MKTVGLVVPSGMANNLLIYGANGYTGKLIVELAADYGLQPILAGRNQAAIQELSEQFHLPYRCAELNNDAAIDELLRDVQVVLHAAGPFIYTAKEMILGCIRNKVHYLDITGEIPVFEMAKSFDAAGKDAEIMIMPGTGFDVVPTDCMALFLKEQLPTAIQLELAFTSLDGGLSHGTARTMIQSIGGKGVVRENGKLVPSAIGEKNRLVDFAKGDWLVASIPWGDLSTAYTTTAIPNITTYTAITQGIYRFLKMQGLFNWFLRTGWFKQRAQAYIKRKPPGPSPESRQKGKSFVWGEVTNAAGEKKSGRLKGPDGYTLTAHSSLLIVNKIMSGNFKTGYQTPAGCYGSGLVLEIPGVEIS